MKATQDPHTLSDSPENQRILGRLVEREVHHCVSWLVYHFMQNPAALEGSDYTEEDLFALASSVDYEEAATAAGWEAFVDEYGAQCYRDSANGMTWAGGSWCDLCEEFDIDLEPGESESLEHWIVSDWLAERLKERGEAVGELFSLTIWGRCCSGQAIYLDSVIADIACEMEILTGQKYAWTE